MLVTRVRPGLAKSRRRAIEEEDERFNPISPLTGNTVMRGGGMPMDPPKSSRNPRHRMADNRAMEIQMRNQTPGTGATPTMGVSQMRGGSMGRYVGGAYLEKDFLDNFTLAKLKQIVKKLNTWSKRTDPSDFYVIRHKPDATKDEVITEIMKAQIDRDTVNDIAQVFPVKVKAVKAPKVAKKKGGSMSRYVGGAMGRCVGGSAVPSMGLSEFRGGGPVEMLLDRSNVSKSGAYEGQGMLRKKSQPELEFSSNMKGGKKHHMNGGALSEHLLKEMGAPSHKALLMGMMDHAKGVHGGAWWDDVRGAFQDFGRKVKNEFVNPESVLRSQVLPKAAQIATVAAPLLDKARPGLGTAIAKGAQTAQGANAAAKSVGLGRRKRAPASAGDGRRKRADIVRKVMNERGCSMIEASKIVKSEGLY